MWSRPSAETRDGLFTETFTIPGGEQQIFPDVVTLLTSGDTSGDWEVLDIFQAAADHHRIVAALKSIYSGARINTGHSKGGMTAVFHRRFYPAMEILHRWTGVAPLPPEAA